MKKTALFRIATLALSVLLVVGLFAGCGQQTKAANQIMIAGALSGVCEAFAYARRQGMSPEAVMEAVAGGSADSAQLRSFGPRLCAGDLQPGFFMKKLWRKMTGKKEKFSINAVT